ncbi:prepilin-type N-terminal cleavage/methylation domain-containing protein [Duganella sp. sic0402]|uniref:PulJ/GspJ family protein n=1 Tax=Duganella sp. sic0402 TaxID=2854786 RepID=UPI001C439442|nr:prepilin-type N-terminal cleavage/methylation domain-containing protein [Duganella sp. sic0402]MBV7538589.1 prepilin-type N-terminal cleavage/methylation domain-containing protein [Duganella sp. sic0402]
MTAHGKKTRGFTLIELLLAIFILAMMAVLGWRGLDSIVRSRGTLTAEMDQTRGLQLAFAQMQSDCAHMANNTLLRSRAFLQAEDNRITLVRMVLAENQPTRLQVVSYRVNADGVLTRRESAATRELAQLDNLWQAALSDVDTNTSVALQANVQNMVMRLWVPGPNAGPVQNAANAGGWRQAAGVSTAGGVPAPTGLEVSLSLQGQQIPMVKAFLLGAL